MSYVSFKVTFTKQQHFTLLFTKKSVKPVAGNNLTLPNVNGSAGFMPCGVGSLNLRQQKLPFRRNNTAKHRQPWNR